MAQLTIAQYLNYINLQMAAEALYGYDGTANPAAAAALIPGDKAYGKLTDPNLTTGNQHASRFTHTQFALSSIENDWTVVEHESNTATGFSGTLFKRLQDDPVTGAKAGEYVLSFRSTEFIDDYARDNQATNKLEIDGKGFAFGQISDMESWYQKLRADSTKLPAGAKLDVTGYSLGGHLATAFNLMHGGELNGGQVVTFNGAGLGRIGAGDAFGMGQLRAMINDFRELRERAKTGIGLGGELATPAGKAAYNELRLKLAEPGYRPDSVLLDILNAHFAGPVATANRRLLEEAINRIISVAAEAKYVGTITSGGTAAPTKPALIPDANIAAENLDYQLAVILTSDKYRTKSLSYARGIGSTIGFPKQGYQINGNQTDVFGNEDSAIKYCMVAFSQCRYGQPIGLFVEDQPLTRGAIGGRYIWDALLAGEPKRLLLDGYVNNDFGDTHSLVLLQDSLNVQNLFARISSKSDQLGLPEKLYRIFAAASHNKAESATLSQGSAEGDVLENVVNAFAQMVLGPAEAFSPLKGSLDGNTWADRDDNASKGYTGRETFYKKVQKIVSSPVYGELCKIAETLSVDVSSSINADIAKRDFSAFLTLQTLAPFRIQSSAGTDALNTALGAGWTDVYKTWQDDAALKPTEPASKRTYSEQWYDDRCKTLGWMLTANRINKTYVYSRALGLEEAWQFSDAATNLKIDVVSSGGTAAADSHRVAFGDASGEEFSGGSVSDHLYGMGGADVIHGLDGNDYIEGNEGADVLFGDAGNDKLLGGAGDDKLWGGVGMDTLYGGAGNDTFAFGTVDGDSWDTIVDPETGDALIYGPAGTTVTGAGTVKTADNLWKSADGQFTFALFDTSEGDKATKTLKVGTANGAAGVWVKDFSNGKLGITLDMTPKPGTTAAALGTGGADHLTLVANGDGLAGNDLISGRYAAGANNDVLVGSDGADILLGYAGDDVLSGGAGADVLVGSNGSDRIDAGDGNDLVINGTRFLGTNGTAYDQSRSMTFSGKSWNDLAGYWFWSLQSGADLVYSGGSAGSLSFDWKLDVTAGGPKTGWAFGAFASTTQVAQADVGNDTVLGGDGNDAIGGSGGNDFIRGDAGNDLIAGWFGNESLFGGSGQDQIAGNQGDDYIDGGTEDDRLWGGIGADSVFGGAGADYMQGDFDFIAGVSGQPTDKMGADLLRGGAGNDYMLGAGGSDSLFGDGDNDTVYGDAANLDGPLHGADLIDGGDGNDVLRGLGGSDTIVGGNGNDELVGDNDGLVAMPDSIHGADYLDGGAGDDQLVGNGGNDTLIGGTGLDGLSGGEGNDTYVFRNGDALVRDGVAESVEDSGGEDTIVLLNYNKDQTCLYTLASGERVLALSPTEQVVLKGDIEHIVLGGNPGGSVSLASSASARVAAARSTLPAPSIAALGASVLAADTIAVADNTSSWEIDLGSSVLDSLLPPTEELDVEGLFARSPFAVGGVGGIGVDSMYGGSVADTLDGGAGNDVLCGAGGDDVLTGGAGNDLLQGGADNDNLLGGDGNDVLIGGSGYDYLSGGSGSDVYRFGLTSGQDTILNEDADEFGINPDKLVFDEDVAPFDVVARAYGDDLYLQVGDAAGVSVRGYLSPLSNKWLETIGFADGTIWDRSYTKLKLLTSRYGLVVQGTTGNDSLAGGSEGDAIDGGSGADTLIGQEGSDVLIGGDGDDDLSGSQGDDVLKGGAGFNTYRFELGDGIDVIDNSFNEGAGEIRFAAGIAAANVTAEHRYDDLVIRIGDAGDTLTVKYFYNKSNTTHGGISDVVFSDGSRLTYSALAALPITYGPAPILGTEYNDNLDGTSQDDRILARGGDDNARGLAGDDEIHGGAGNDQLFGDSNEYYGDGIPKTDPAGLNDVLWGEEGNDSLFGDSGDDTLIGGAGDDLMWGGLGNDTYRVDRDSGFDVIEAGDRSGTANLDVIEFGEGITASSLSITRVGTDLVLRDKGGKFGVRVSNAFYQTPFVQDCLSPSVTACVGSVVFADGSRLSQAELFRLTSTATEGDDILNLTGNKVAIDALGGNDWVTGTFGPDTLLGGGGNDTIQGKGDADSIVGGSGNDRLIGGTGSDTLTGGVGDDTYVLVPALIYDVGDSYAGMDDVVVEASNEGADTVTLAITSALEATSSSPLFWQRASIPTNVENLNVELGVYLRNLSLRGNPGDNRIDLTGATGSATIDGAGGRDTMIGGETADQYVVDGLDDVVLELGVDGSGNQTSVDTVLAQVDGYVLPVNVENLKFEGADNLSGSGNAAANALTGNMGANTLDGAAGDDTLDGWEGADVLIGGAGADTYKLQGYTGVDVVLNADTDGGFDQIAIGWGIAPSDVVVDRYADDLIVGVRDSTNALVIKSHFSTSAVGTSRLDQVSFSDGTIWDAATLATLAATAGTSGSHRFLVSGDTAASFTGGDLTDALIGGGAGDTLVGNGGNDTLDGGAGNDRLNGGADADSLKGGAGDDELDGGAGRDTLIGGTGDDIYYVDDATDAVLEVDGQGTDTVFSTVTYRIDGLIQYPEGWSTQDDFNAFIENLTLVGTAAINATGNARSNVIRGNSAANVMTGGKGDDTYYVGTGDSVKENANEGTDSVFSDVTWTLSSNVENLTLAGTANINGTGNASANRLSGNSGNNILNGGSGVDTMAGGAGDDTYVVENVADVVTELAGQGLDLVQSSVTYTLGANVENLTLTGTSAVNGTGNGLNNIITGNSAANTLSGGAGDDRLVGMAGADTMIGGTGNDTYVVDATTDVVTENANEGTDTVESSVSLTLANNLENLLLTGSSALTGTGNALNNVLTGNSGANKLTGGAGNDRLDGLAGNDTMLGGIGDDTYVVNVTTDVVTENANEGTDTVESAVTLTLAANVENLTLTGTAAINGTGNTLANVLIGNAAANILSGGAGLDTIQGGLGNDTVDGGVGNDTYLFGRGDQADTLTDADSTAGNQDTLLFGSGVAAEQLWFRKVGTADLEVSIIGTADKITIKNWSASGAGTNNQIEVFKTADGRTLSNAKVANLVTAMASLTPPAVGQTTLPASYQTALLSTINANWTAATVAKAAITTLQPVMADTPLTVACDRWPAATPSIAQCSRDQRLASLVEAMASFGTDVGAIARHDTDFRQGLPYGVNRMFAVQR